MASPARWGGFIKLYRQILESPHWLDEPFTRGQAWVDMILLANREAGFVRKQGIRIDLERGDLGWSENELASRWKWSRGKVRRFFNELEKDGMIERKKESKTDKRKFVITICNYSKFQDKDSENGQAADKRRTSGGTRTRRKEGKKKRKYIVRRTCTWRCST
jgi:DNA-binding MarR family transcriptional regulator